jgi:isopentenyl-diphosphate delta-isomerase
MTGGTSEAETINLRLAEAAQECGNCHGSGSVNAPPLNTPNKHKTFQVRRVAPDILLFANLGAVQFNYGYGVDQCRKAVDMIQADALIPAFESACKKPCKMRATQIGSVLQRRSKKSAKNSKYPSLQKK